MKQLWFLVLLFVVACNPSPQATNSGVPTAKSNSPTLTITPSPTYTLVPTNTSTITPSLTNTATNTPLPPTPRPTRTLTPTPKPITHANIGWEDVIDESQIRLPDEQRIKSQILVQNQKSERFSSVKAEDIKVIWYTADDGTIFWQPYFTMNLSQANNDLFLYIFPLIKDSSGILNISEQPKILNISAIERLGYIDNITNIQLVWDDHNNKPTLAIERNGVRLWYPEELNNILISYDQDIRAFGLPEKPEPASDFIVVMDITHVHDAYLFKYDKTEVTFAGISEPNRGPIYELKDNQWRVMNHPEFIGGGSPQIAYIGYDSHGIGNLYVEELPNNQTGILVSSNIHTPLAPAAIIYDAEVSNMTSSKYYYVLASPVWSPDGRHIAFIAKEDNKPVLAVYDLDAQTWQSLVKIPANPDGFLPPIWSPEDDWLMYGVGRNGYGFSTLNTVSYPDGVVHEIDQGTNPQWLQDDNGLRLNYQKFVGEFFMANPDGTNIEQMTFSVQSKYENGFSWYVPEQNAFLVYREKLNKFSYVPLDGSKETILTQFPEQDGIYSYSYSIYSISNPSSNFSPDGKWFLLSAKTQDGQRRSALQNLETQEIRVYERELNFVAGWSPDNRGIIHWIFGPAVFDITTGEIAYLTPFLPLRIAKAPWNNNPGNLYWSTE